MKYLLMTLSIPLLLNACAHKQQDTTATPTSGQMEHVCMHCENKDHKNHQAKSEKEHECECGKMKSKKN